MKHKHAELIHAWADGAIIQLKVHDGWVDANNLIWNERVEYRIKPEPLVLYVNEYNCKNYSFGNAYETREEAIGQSMIDGYIRTIKLQEVTE